jgi:hypothetical protein
MRKFHLIIALILLSFVCNGQTGWREGEMEIRVNLESENRADELGRLHLNGDIYSKSGYALLYVTPDELEKLRSGGFLFDILKNDLNEYFKDFWSTRDQYHSYDDIIQTANNLCISYSSICKKISYGESVEGRELFALKISDNVNSDENEAEIMFDGGIHGDEIGGSENLIRFASDLCANYGVNPEITDLVDNREIWLYIMVNPDGRVNMVRYNSNGVDVNRDWGYMWDGESNSPGYYSQPETKALRSCMLENQFVVQTSYHSGTVYLAYPWSYRPDACPDVAQINQLAGIYVTYSGYTDMPYEQGYTGMYPINGSSKDAMYGIMGSVSWSIEISMDKQPPASQIQYYYDLNKPAMLSLIEYAGYGLSGIVYDATNGHPVAATVFVEDYYPCYSDPFEGDYHKYLLAGSYQVRVVANGYQPMTQTALIVNDPLTTLDFALQPEYNQYAYRVIACNIPDTNFADEAKTYAALWDPDEINYSLGKSGWVILDMQQEIIDGAGIEIIVHEGDNDPEGFSCYAGESIDGPWILAGSGTGTTSFDFSTAGITSARYIRINDDGIGQPNGDNAGFDLDAVEAPDQPEMIFLTIDCKIDDPSGNNNHRIDPGENDELIVTLHNLGGLLMENGQAYLNIDHQYLSVVNPDAALGNLDFGDSVQFSFALNCSSFCPLEEILMTALNITSNDGAFSQSFPLNFTAGAIVEDWETANMTKFDWSVSGNKPWAINFLNPYEGIYSAKSGNIDDNQVSALEVTFDLIGYDDISFYYKVSSEAGSDFLKFYIDDVLKGYWSGEVPWTFQTFGVSPGQHTFKWTFEKDNLYSQGSDGGWIDYIVFPSANIDGTFKAFANANPNEFCGPGESQLGAYVTGGSGNYNFAWTPAQTLDDPTLQFPLSNISETTLFMVSVDDGADIVSSSIEVKSDPVPGTPEILQESDSLVSSAVDGNQWYNLDGAIDGATGQVFYPPIEDDYFVMTVNSSGCVSDTSNIIHFLFTGITEPSTDPEILVYPNPFHDELKIIFPADPENGISVRITDLPGRTMFFKIFQKSDLQKCVNISTSSLGKSLFLVEIRNLEGKLLVSKKLIKL